MQVAMMPGQSPSSTLNNGNASTPDPPVSSSASSSDADRLRASMEAWKRTAAIASERYSEARQRQIAAEREDRHELRKRWLEEEAKKRAESVGKQKDGLSGGNVSSNMPPTDRKRHLDNNDYGHEEWRQGFRMMEGSGMPEISKASADMYGNMGYHTPNGSFYPGMMMHEMQQQGKGVMVGFSSPSAPSFRGNSFPTSQTVSSSVACSPMPSTSTADASTLGQRFPSMELPQFPISTDSTPVIQQQSQQAQFSTSDSTPYSCGMRPSPSMCPTSPNEVAIHPESEDNQQYHMVMMQKHQQHMKAMMQQRAAMMYQGYPNGANMSQQQYFMHMQKMQQARFASGVDPSASAFMSGQRMMGMRGAPMSAAGPMMEPMPPAGGYPSGYPQGMQPFPPQQQYVGQFSMN
ncbi:MamL-1 domain protein [Ostertagia ostertagi]